MTDVREIGPTHSKPAAILAVYSEVRRPGTWKNIYGPFETFSQNTTFYFALITVMFQRLIIINKINTMKAVQNQNLLCSFHLKLVFEINCFEIRQSNDDIDENHETAKKTVQALSKTEAWTVKTSSSDGGWIKKYSLHSVGASNLKMPSGTKK